MPSKTDLPDIAQHKRTRPPKGACSINDKTVRSALNSARKHSPDFPHTCLGRNFPATIYTTNRYIYK